MSPTTLNQADRMLMRMYSFTIPTIMHYRPDAVWAELSPEPRAVLERLEAELCGEMSRYWALSRAILAVALMPILLAGFLWSGLYWLPVRVPWYPFFRGEYGLPWLSLFEWLAFLLLAAFLAYAWALLHASRLETRHMAADLRVIRDAKEAERGAIVAEATSGAYPRSEILLTRAQPLSVYRELLGEGAHR